MPTMEDLLSLDRDGGGGTARPSKSDIVDHLQYLLLISECNRLWISAGNELIIAESIRGQ
ncbi:hypothetical protein F443_03412 [Phytophthora nicotianae P1569]|uniref:Uncharacterized protein n=1 Tax=Phytophthora nicotianae P1569 TaxID=1317065 RepID=V9FTF9_PHYNI|nr:hypothetical protein F443_03412 [Phytophthora nicotianae P1569]